jgi:hypothetical protein
LWTHQAQEEFLIGNLIVVRLLRLLVDEFLDLLQT